MAAATTFAAASPGTSSSNRAHQPNDGLSTLLAIANDEEQTSSDPRLLSADGKKKLSSFPSRQRKMGPAPLASFEDLSMDKTTSDSSSADERNTLPGIGEESSEPLSPNSPSARAMALTVPASPRIRVSAASSSSAHDTDSKESTPDRELFIGYTKKDYCEEMSDVKTSTEELLDEEERLRRAKEKAKRIESEKYEEALRVADKNRKQSSSSVISENLLPVASGHNSRLSSLGSIGSNARRSPSPHKMLLETSFCGSKPIQQPSIDLDDPPISSAKLLDYTLESMDHVKTILESNRDLSQSPPPMLPPHWKDSPETQTSFSQIMSRSVSSKSATTDTSSEKVTSPKKSLFQERRDKIDQELTRIHQQPSPRRQTPEKFSGHTEHRSRVTEYQMSTAEGRNKGNESSDLQTDLTSRSPRLGKKVLPQQAPDLKELRKTTTSSGAPIPPPLPPSSSNNSSTIVATSESIKNRSYSTTPSASPKLGRKYLGKKNKEGTGTESGSSTPSTSRNSSFSSLFRRGEAALSPVTPDSPGSLTGRSKSPFSQLIKSARNEFRSRSRSRSRSKSRDRDLEDDTHDRRGVLSIFKPKKKKGDNEVSGIRSSNGAEQKPSEAILNVEFTFKEQENSFPSSEIDGFEQSQYQDESEPEIVKETVIKEINQASSFKQHKESPESSFSEKSIKKTDEKVTSKSYQSVIESLEQRQREIAEKSITPEPKEEVKNEFVPEVIKMTNPGEASPVSEKTDELNIKNTHTEEDSRSESEREVEYYKKKQQLGIEDDHAISSDVEIKKLVGHDFAEEDELPYVPTTLPQERSQVSHMIPVKDRTPSLRMIQAIDRPRSTTPILPSRLDQYRESIDAVESESDGEKLTVIIPMAALPPKQLFKQSSKSWEDFCQEGLKSPRTLRREYRENSLQSTDDELKSSAKTPTKSPIKSPSSTDITPLESPKNWINFEEIPDIVMKPVRQIKTVQTKTTVPSSQDLHRKPKLIQQKRVDVSKMNDSYHSPDQSQNRKRLDRELSDDIQGPLRSSVSTPERDDSSEKSSDSERLGSQSSSEELTTIREKIAEIKKKEDKRDLDDSSDLERLLAPVNDCIAKLSSLSVQGTVHCERKSPIPDNWEDFLLPPHPGRRSRLSSLGSEAGSVGGGRSPSPSHMLLETSFCGSQPIDDPGFEEPNVPIAVARRMSGISLGDLTPLVPRSDRGTTTSLHHFNLSDRASIFR